MNQETLEFDVLVVGGGLVGGSLALALADSPLRVGLVEAQSDTERLSAPAGGRALALSRSTVQRLAERGLWADAAAHAMAIRHIHVSDRGHFGKVRLHAADCGVDALGHVLVARVLEAVLLRKLEATGVFRLNPVRVMGVKAGQSHMHATLKQGQVQLHVAARLLVAADGGHSTVRTLLGVEQHTRDYGQTAVVTEVTTTRDNRHTAYERFTASGPIAFLPLEPRKCSVVWTLDTEEAEDTLRLGEREFTERLQQAFGHWLGGIGLASRPVGFPLSLVRADRMTDRRVVFIGNAMHQIHPVAGQGFNLGLRDAAILADRILTQTRLGGDIGDPDFLDGYAGTRQRDLERVVRFTDSLVRIFSNEFPPLVLARNLALTGMDRLPRIKRFLSHQAMGYGA